MRTAHRPRLLSDAASVSRPAPCLRLRLYWPATAALPLGAPATVCQLWMPNALTACLARGTDVSKLAHHLHRSDAVYSELGRNEKPSEFSILHNYPASVVTTVLSACLRGCVRPRGPRETASA